MATATTSTIPAFRTALKDLLTAREGLSGVQVTRHIVGNETDAYETIQMMEVSGEQNHRSSPMQREERYTLKVGIQVIKDGAGEDVAHAAETRMFALLKEIEDTLRTDQQASGDKALNANAGILNAQVADYENEGVRIMDGRRVAQMEVNIDVHAFLHWS